MFCLIADLNSVNLVLINADIELIKSSFRGDLVPVFIGGGRGREGGNGGVMVGSFLPESDSSIIKIIVNNF